MYADITQQRNAMSQVGADMTDIDAQLSQWHNLGVYLSAFVKCVHV